MSDPQTSVTAIVNGLFLLVGVIVTAIGSILTPWLVKRSEDKRAAKTLAVNAGLDMWRMHCNLTMEKAKLVVDGKIEHDGDFRIGPADPFIGHTLRLLAIATNPKLTPEEADRQIKALPPLSESPENEEAEPQR